MIVTVLGMIAMLAMDVMTARTGVDGDTVTAEIDFLARE